MFAKYVRFVLLPGVCPTFRTLVAASSAAVGRWTARPTPLRGSSGTPLHWLRRKDPLGRPGTLVMVQALRGLAGGDKRKSALCEEERVRNGPEFRKVVEGTEIPGD